MLALLDNLNQQEAPKLFPREYRDMLDAFERGEALLHGEQAEGEADLWYRFALQKGALLGNELAELRQRRIEEEQRRRAMEQAEQAEKKRLQHEMEEPSSEQQQKRHDRQESAESAAKAKPGVKNSAPLPGAYTVRRGETLPQIAGRAEIYNDAALWPIIYRANRDQIRDPRRLWPGQVLVIPRHFTRDEAMEARRYSGRK
jgi:nucleoid-associated protein YgaU